MVKRRTFIAFLAGIPFFPTSLLPKEKEKARCSCRSGIECSMMHRPWEVHCFDKRGNETLYISDVQRNSEDEITVTYDWENNHVP